MRLIHRFLVDISVMFYLPEDEVDTIIKCAENHYDSKVVGLAQGTGLVQPTLYNWKYRAQSNEDITATPHEIDLALKALEIGSPFTHLISHKLHKVFDKCNKLYLAIDSILSIGEDDEWQA